IGASICALWDDLYPPDGGQIAYYYSAADNAMIVEWYNISHYPSGSNAPETFQIWLYNVATNPGPNGDSQIRIQYLNTSAVASCTAGIQDGSAIASQYVFNNALDVSSQGLEDLRVIAYGGSTIPEIGYISGVVTNSVTSLPIAGVAVTVQGYPQNDVTDANGLYNLTLAPGTYDLDFALAGYVPASRAGIVVTDQMTTTLDVAMMALPVVTFIDEDFESGAPGWTHDAAVGWVDNWHISTERAASGIQSYKCGDPGTGTYSNLCDARLTSPVFSNLPNSASLSFVMQIESELSGAYPDSAYDGGMIEMSVDGGAFTLVHPTPDYSKQFRYLRGGGLPYNGPVAGAPCLAGTVTTWTAYSLDLSSYEGQSVQFRFRFGSDAGTGREGWYVDDVLGSGFGSPIPDPPTNLTIFVNPTTGTLDFDWEGSAPMYQLFSATSPEGPFDTLEGSTAATSLSIPTPGPATLFYHVVSTNGALRSEPTASAAPAAR
ncbi:carboxypeptidase regulatory-like domain-containing protein, partial [bacterium]|nr:carboxypeptidase regulatory-like domain-containing protein [bacterium]